MTDAEYRDLTAEARGVDNTDIRAVISRELNKPLALNDTDGLTRHALDR
jgi:hypothetical protein